MKAKGDGDGLNDAIAKVLRYGVVLSFAVLAVGLVVLVLAPPPGAPDTLQGVLGANFGKPSLDLSSMGGGISLGNGVSILELGALILMATPVTRVAASVVLFMLRRDLVYVGITSLVLAMLLVAIFLLGPAEA